MKQRASVSMIALVLVLGGCAELDGLGGTTYGETGSAAACQSERDGKITQVENIKVDENY